MTLSAVTRRKVLAGTAIAIVGSKEGAFGRNTPNADRAADPAVSIWQEWRAAHDHTDYLCRKQQRLERKLVETVGVPCSTVLLLDGQSLTLHSLPELREALDHSQEDLSIRARAEADLAAHQARWDLVDSEIGYSAAIRAECDAADRADQLFKMLSEVPAASLAGVAVKLEAVLVEGQSSKDDGEFPWPQIRSALEDVIRIGNHGESNWIASLEGTLRTAFPMSTLR